ncbi:ATP-binding cassette domain-containing protein [Arthrobacter sp. ISL-69]|nr:ATP-binding cassette domain-containing protein [Arthrobacter sp. ISL-69]
MIEASNLCKEYGGKRVVSDVSLVANAGEVTGFVGPNGAGKSTVLRIIAGITAPSSGSVRVGGATHQLATHPAANLGVFLSAEWIPGSMTAASFLSYVCETQGLRRQRVPELLDLVGLSDVAHRKVKNFSLGTRQRLGIAAAFAGNPRNVVLDEPINGLDPDAIQWIRRLLRQAADDGKAVLLSSHHMGEPAKVADHIVLIDHGVVARQGPLASFVAPTESNVYIESGTLADVAALLRSAGYAVEPHRNGLLVQNAEPAETGRAVYGAGYGLTHLSLVTRSLEETYFDTVSPRDIFSEGNTR